MTVQEPSLRNQTSDYDPVSCAELGFNPLHAECFICVSYCLQSYNYIIAHVISMSLGGLVDKILDY